LKLKWNWKNWYGIFYLFQFIYWKHAFNFLHVLMYELKQIEIEMNWNELKLKWIEIEMNWNELKLKWIDMELHTINLPKHMHPKKGLGLQFWVFGFEFFANLLQISNMII